MALMAFICVSCATPKVVERDSVYVTKTIEVRDTIVEVTIPEGYVEASGVDTAKAQTTIAEAKAWMEGDKINLALRNKSENKLYVPMALYNRVEFKDHIIVREIEKEVKKPIPTFVLVFAVIGAIFVVILITKLVLKLK